MTVTTSQRKPLVKLKAELDRRGISQVELARRMQMKRSYLSQMLNGIEPLKPHYARLISICTQIPLRVVLSDGEGAAV